MRGKFWRAGVLAMALVGALIVAPTLPATADTIPPTQYTPVPLNDMPDANYVMTQPDGGATLGCSSSGVAFKTFSMSGAVTQSRPVTTNYATGIYYNVCGRGAAVGSDGTLFAMAYTNTFQTAVIQAIKDNVVKWTYTVPCGAITVRGLVVGTNGNVYFVASGAHSPCTAANLLIGVTPMVPNGSTTPTVVLNQALSVTGYVMDGGVSAYNGGIAIRTSTGIQYVTNAGVATDYTVSNVMSVGGWEYSDTTLAGRYIAAVGTTPANQQLCGNDVQVVGGIYAYGPSGQAWGYNSLPACSRVYELRPTPTGGAVIRYDSPQGGIPGNPRVPYLLGLDAGGNQMWQFGLSPTDPTVTNVAFATAVDLNGNVAVQRQVRYRLDANGTSYFFPALQLQLLSGFSGGVIGSYELSGVHNVPNGTGYDWAGVGNFKLSVAHNIWYVPAVNCTTANSCTASTAKLYAFKVSGLQMDYPRGAIVSAAATNLSYVAMGDSFSSGEGVPAFDASTDTAGPPENRCHRSTTGAYSRLLAASPSAHLSLTSFVACSGATTAQITGTWPSGKNTNEATQVNALSASTKVVTITIGGNDVGFADFASACVFNGPVGGGCNTTAAYPTILSKIQFNLPGALNAALAGIKAKIGTQTRVLVVGYPMMMPDASTNTAANCPYFDSGEKTAARDVITRLNAALQDAVNAANNVQQNHNFEYVDAAYNGSPFNGHEVCTDGGYFNTAQVPQEYSLHPNANGQDAYRQVLLHYLG